MRVYYSSDSDVYILDSVEGLKETWQAISEFLLSNARSIFLEGRMDSSPEPFDRALMGIELEKSGDAVDVAIARDGRLRIAGNVGKLRAFLAPLDVGPSDERTHRHLGQSSSTAIQSANSLGLVIEIDSARVAELDEAFDAQTIPPSGDRQQ